MAMAGSFLDLFFFQLARGLGFWKGAWLGICDGSMKRSEKTLDGDREESTIDWEKRGLRNAKRETERERICSLMTQVGVALLPFIFSFPISYLNL